MFQFVLNSLGQGTSLQRLIRSNMDVGVLRPYMEIDPRSGMPTGRSLINVNQRNQYTGMPLLGPDGKPLKKVITTNAPTTLLEQDWKLIDRKVQFAVLQRLKLWGDVFATNPYVIPNGYGTIAVTHNTAVRNATAMISMDPVRRGRRSRPIMEAGVIPLPCIHSDGDFTSREIAVTANNPQMRVDTSGIESAARAVAETVEHLIVGDSTYTYAGGTIYGVRNHPNRFTKVLTAPTGTNGGTTLGEVAAMVQTLKDNFFYGPYIAYYSNAWQQYFARDYTTTYSQSLFQRLQQGLPDISAWRNLDFLTGYQIILVQMTSDVIEAIQGMAITTVQWEEQGGFEQCFKVLCIQLPRIRANAYGHTGINHGAAP